MCHVALSFVSLRRLIRQLYREWNAASDPRRGRRRVYQGILIISGEPSFTRAMKRHNHSSGARPIQYDGQYSRHSRAKANEGTRGLA
jgi:hypothetical protein